MKKYLQSVGSKLVAGFGVAVLVLLTQSWISYYFNTQYATLSRLGGQEARTLLLTHDIVSTLRDAEIPAKRLLETWKGTAEEGIYEVRYTALSKVISDLENRVLEKKEILEEVKNVREALLQMNSYAQQLFSVGKKIETLGPTDPGRKTFIEEAKKRHLLFIQFKTTAEDGLRGIQIKFKENLSSLFATIEGQRNKPVFISAVLVLAASLLLGFFGMIIVRAISRPLRSLANIADEIAREGNTQKKIDIAGMKFAEAKEEAEEEAKYKSTKDEVTLVAVSFNRLIRSMRRLGRQAKIIAADDLANPQLDQKIGSSPWRVGEFEGSRCLEGT